MVEFQSVYRCNITPRLNTDFAITWKSAAAWGHKRGYGLACTPWLDGVRMPTHVVRPGDLAKRAQGELAGEKSITKFRPFYFGEPKVTGKIVMLSVYARRFARYFSHRALP